ncbi:hypothetical protein MKW92_045841 [Papaver armeniacum]|nr:hypothetical protein MKW92_045841 [Papaver armeniacum]
MASDFGFSIQSDVPPGFQFTPRPWLDLYGVSIKPFIHFGSVASKPFSDPALIHRSLPDELLHEVFARMTPYSLGRAACVCRKWRYTIRNPVFWRSACLKAWQVKSQDFQSTYQGSWRKMWLLRPRIRTDGLYVSRNTYVRCGTPEWKTSNPVHVVCYFRYIRFFQRKIPLQVKDVVKCMNFRAPKADSVEVAIMYPGSRPTVFENPHEVIPNFLNIYHLNSHIVLFIICWYSRRLRGTTVGANNRMDLLSLVTSGVNENELSGNEDNILGVVEGWQEDETHDPDVPAVSHRRGMTPFVFVPFEEKMDYFVTG